MDGQGSTSVRSRRSNDLSAFRCSSIAGHLGFLCNSVVIACAELINYYKLADLLVVVVEGLGFCDTNKNH